MADRELPSAAPAAPRMAASPSSGAERRRRRLGVPSPLPHPPARRGDRESVREPSGAGPAAAAGGWGGAGIAVPLGGGGRRGRRGRAELPEEPSAPLSPRLRRRRESEGSRGPRGSQRGSGSPSQPTGGGRRGPSPTLANTLALCWTRSRKGWKYGESWKLPGDFGRTFAGGGSADVYR